MTEVLERATISAFQKQVDARIDYPHVQLLEIYRRMNTIYDTSSEIKRLSLSDIRKIIASGLIIGINGLRFATNFVEERKPNNRIKKLSRTVSKQTRSPKTSRATIYRRNSRTIERRVQASNWRIGAKSIEERLLRRRVELIPESVWSERQKIIDQQTKAVEKIRIAAKKDFRFAKLLALTEKKLSPESISSNFLRLLTNSCEKNGIVNPEILTNRVYLNLSNNEPQPVVFIWGPPYEKQGRITDSIRPGSPELNLINQITAFLQETENTGLEVKPILIYADYYGYAINGLPTAEVESYFTQIQKSLPKNFITISYSELINQNYQQWLEISKKVNAEIVFPTENELGSAKKTQLKLGNKLTTNQAVELARAYRVQRLIEGKLLTQGFSLNGVLVNNIIKLATAPNKLKDDPYEPDLPRFYIKNLTRAPWNKTRT